jgi:signal transduction histidine kinase/ligand-binding sensor domain-containing protein
LADVALILGLVDCLHMPAAWPAPRQVAGFHHTMWTSDNGLGAVFDVQQASDGFLWLTTSTGVFRFDGVRFQSVEEVTNGAVENSQIHSAFLSSSGGVWLKTRAAGLLFWRDGRLSVFKDRRCTPALEMEGLAEDQDGTLWIQGSGGLFLMRGSACDQVGAEHGYRGGFPAAILVDHKGTVWVRTLGGDLLLMPRGQSRFQRLQYAAGAISAAFVLAAPSHNAFLHEAPDGAIWLSDDYGLRRVTNPAGAPVVSSIPGKRRKIIQFGDFTFAGDGSLWAASNRGVRRFDHPEQWRTSLTSEDAAPGDSFTTEQGLSSNAAWKVLVDREGSVWVGTNAGLDQLRRTTLTALPFPMAEEHDFSIAAGDRGSAWTGNRSMALTRVAADGSITTFPQTRGTVCLRRDRRGMIWSTGGDDSRLWRYSAAGLAPLHYPAKEAGPVISLAVDRNGDPWVTTAIGGTYHLSHGAWSRQNETLGKRPGIIGAMTGDEAGNVWFGFSNYLIQWDGSAYQRFSFPNGARGVSESTMSVRGDHVWLGGSGGIELFTEGHFYLLRWNDQDLPGRVSGVVETQNGELWANGSSGITHVSAAELARWLSNPTSAISADHLAALDGLPGYSVERIPEPSIAESREGRLWFATAKGIAWLDPAKLQENRNRIPPPVMISAIFSNGKTYAIANDVSLPAHSEKLQIDYTALSLAIPERVLFRYKLEPIDAEWQDAGTRREAFYTSLPPGRYRFRVMACNNDAVWNESGATLKFEIAPAYYQTWWFKVLWGLVAALILWWLIRLRIRRITHELHSRLAGRLAERERIARDLHDTLLQSFQGLMIKFYTLTYVLDRPTQAREMLESLLEQGRQAMEEGRDAVRGMRASTVIQNDLARSVAMVGERLAAEHNVQNPVDFRVLVEGEPRDMHPILRDEVYRIASEATRNAFRHSGATRISVDIWYDDRQLRIRIEDNGKGIDPKVLDGGGREGHYGVPGMHERAKLAGGKLTVRSRLDSGTEIELTIPASLAYTTQKRSEAPSGEDGVSKTS